MSWLPYAATRGPGRCSSAGTARRIPCCLRRSRLYDYPQIAAESPGEFFDGTEIDEMLVLRILTLTDEESQAAAAVDERARALLTRTRSMSEEQMMGLHGTVRGLRPVPAGESAMNDWNPIFDQPRLASLRVNGVELKPGDRVRLRPRAAQTSWTWPWTARSRRSKQSNRILKSECTLASFWTMIPAGTWESCASQATAFISASTKWSRSSRTRAQSDAF